MAEREEPERAARQLEQELNNIAGLIGQSSSSSGPTLEELIRKLDQVRTEGRHAVADTQARRALEARQVVMMDDLISRVRAEHDPATLQRTLQGLYSSRDADERDPRLPAADSDYSSGDDSYRHSSQSSSEPPVSDGDDDDDYIPVPRKPVPALAAGAPPSQPEDNSGWASLVAAFYHKLVLSRPGAIRRSVVLFVVVLVLALILAAVLASHH
jgi:hypothetical protein